MTVAQAPVLKPSCHYRHHIDFVRIRRKLRQHRIIDGASFTVLDVDLATLEM